MNFYNLNIKQLKNPNDPKRERGDRKSWARICLDKDDCGFLFKDGIPRAPIFFGTATIDELLKGPNTTRRRDWAESRAFCVIGQDERLWEETRIITVHEGWVWIYQPAGRIEEFRHKDIAGLPEWDSMKCFPVKICYHGMQKDVPLVLASMRSNQAFSRGTFREILPDRYPGNFAAIEYLLGQKPHTSECLQLICSLEFETLVAKIFEEAGCFVSAYSGGGTEGFDLVVFNDGKNDIDVNGIVVAAGGRVSLQLKLHDANFRVDTERADCWITNSLTNRDEEGLFDRRWVEKCQATYPKSWEWLARATRWAK